MVVLRSIRHAVLAGLGVVCCLWTSGAAIAHPGNGRGHGPPTGACCVTAAGITTCSVRTHQACNRARGQYKGNNIACGPANACPVRGACCFTSGRCDVMYASRCAAAGGTYQTDGSTCGPTNPCPQPVRGACCINHRTHAHCVVLTAAGCAAATGTYQGNSVACITTPTATCPQPVVGACCIAATATVGTRCRIGSAAFCTTAGGTYGGDGSTCRTANCPTSCACDWDRNGLLTHADWVAFLNDWLAGNGDFNGNGVTDRQDALDFDSCFDGAPAGCVRGGR